jgi:protein-disulfide isomerase
MIVDTRGIKRMPVPRRRAGLLLPLLFWIAAMGVQQQLWAKVAAKDWTAQAALTPERGMRIGNPEAKIRLVEYGSLWCSHCREHYMAGIGPLTTDFIRTGKVSYEFRNVVLNGPDLAATLLARCGTPADFWRRIDSLYRRQPEWQRNYAFVPAADLEKMQALAPEARIVAFARAAKMDAFLRPLGVTEAAFSRCLTDRTEIDRVTEDNRKAIEGAGVRATPTFLINGSVAENIAGWEDLRQQLVGAH